MTQSFFERAREIGFNDQVRRDSRVLQVQTEVAVRRTSLVIRTTVMEDGAASIAQCSDCPADTHDLATVLAAAKTQHFGVVDKLQQGEVT